MAKKLIYSIKDELTGFIDLHLMNDEEGDNPEAVAIRDFAELCKSSPLIQRNFEDYNLYLLGSYDNKTGKFLSEDTPVLVCKASQFYGKDKDKENG